MASIIILADHAERLSSLTNACNRREVDVTLDTASIESFQPSGDSSLLGCEVVILDHNEPVQSCYRVVEEIRAANERARILVTGIPAASAPERIELIFGYLEHGAAGYLTVDRTEYLSAAIDALVSGGAWIEPEMTSELVERTIALRETLAMIRPHRYGAGQPEVLTRRQSEVLELLAEGKTNQEIAEELFISVGTVKNHVHRILDALQAASRDQAAEYYQYLQSPSPAA